MKNPKNPLRWNRITNPKDPAQFPEPDTRVLVHNTENHRTNLVTYRSNELFHYWEHHRRDVAGSVQENPTAYTHWADFELPALK